MLLRGCNSCSIWRLGRFNMLANAITEKCRRLVEMKDQRC